MLSPDEKSCSFSVHSVYKGNSQKKIVGSEIQKIMYLKPFDHIYPPLGFFFFFEILLSFSSIGLLLFTVKCGLLTLINIFLG